MSRFVCGECLGDEGLARFVAQAASANACSFCAHKQDSPIAASVPDVALFMRLCLEQDYGHPTAEHTIGYPPGATFGTQRAIRWTDVDFELARVYVRRSAPSGFTTIKAPKSNRQRWVDLTPELAAALRVIRHGAELIFCDDDGSLLRPGQFQEVLWAAQKRAGLRRIKWHDLRHSYASILASGGMPLFLIRGLLGHSSIAMTERYAHLAASQTAAYMPLLSAAGPSKPTPPQPPSGPQAGPNTLASRN